MAMFEACAKHDTNWFNVFNVLSKNDVDHLLLLSRDKLYTEFNVDAFNFRIQGIIYTKHSPEFTEAIIRVFDWVRIGMVI